jgi:hypothetical protein
MQPCAASPKSGEVAAINDIDF